jgi:hypothetical protein
MDIINIDYEWLISELEKKIVEGVKIERRFHLQREIKGLIKKSTIEYDLEDIYKIMIIICELSPKFKIICTKHDIVDDQPMTAIGMKHYIKWKYGKNV